MSSVPELQVRDQLLSRRQRLNAAHGAGVQLPVGDLLAEIDAALARLDAGSFGLCDTCHEPIEADRLAADPLARFCLDHLTPQQRSHLEYDLRLAGDIQRALLPSPDVALPGWDLHYVYQPAGAVSGDYCDLIISPAGPLVVVADVSGKGVAASLLMSNLHALFRTLSASGVPFADMVPRANRIFCESTLPSSYATLALAKFDPDGTVEICNAGHCSPLLVRDHAVEAIPPTGTAVGMFCEGRFGSVRHHLDPGDLLVTYTDGVTETFDRSGDDYGLERFERVLSPLAGQPPKAVTRASLDDIARFRGTAPVRDDLTLMVVRRLP